jgi:hypothetical protein
VKGFEEEEKMKLEEYRKMQAEEDLSSNWSEEPEVIRHKNLSSGRRKKLKQNNNKSIFSEVGGRVINHDSEKSEIQRKEAQQAIDSLKQELKHENSTFHPMKKTPSVRSGMTDNYKQMGRRTIQE